jgi:threonine/homoserine/homoserine lactone efflux protein
MSRGHAGTPLTFLQAALFQWVNPKAWSIAAGALAAFAMAGGDEGAIVRTIVLAAIFGILAFPCVAFWTMLGMGASKLFATRKAMRVFNIAMAGLLVVSLIPSILGIM